MEATVMSQHPNTQVAPLFPFLDLAAQFRTIREEVIAAAGEIFESQHFILGSQVKSLEEQLAQRLRCSFAIGCASGSDALLLALMALGIGLGDEVITTPFTFVATAGSVARLGARPVFVDIDPETYNIDPGQIEKVISNRTRAIIPVHLFGLAADMEAIARIAEAHRLPVIEDAAQAIDGQYRSVPVGSIGTLGCFSFFPSKNLGGAGDGGLITTNDAELADRLKVLRVHGSRTKYCYENLGINSRLDTLQAAILKVKLQYLSEWTRGRQRNAGRYLDLFQQYELTTYIKVPSTPPDRSHVFNQFVIRSSRRDALREHLRQAGIPSEIYYPVPLHLQPAFAYLEHKPGDFPHSEAASREVLALPIFPELTEAQQTVVVAAMAEFFQQVARIGGH
jgi:dTDP-4-amino-4,6-dideoxygalactose transaminase